MKRTLSLVISFVLVLSIIPMGLLKITASAATSGYYTYTVSNGEATITDCKTSISGAVTVPAMLGGFSVTGIGESAFEDCTNLTSIALPDSVTSIGGEAFYKCTGLTSITIPDSVTSIGTNAFAYCSSLKYNQYDNGEYLGNATNPYVVLCDTVSSSITSIEIHETTKVIGYFAFLHCNSLTCVSIPDGVTTIGERAFYNCTGPTSITIPDSVTGIGDLAFYECTGLTSITIPDGVTSIGERAFYKCTGLTSATIGNGVTSIGNDAFDGCIRLQSVTIGNGVVSIGSYAFEGCTSLISVTIPDSVTSIGDWAFYNCSNLSSVTIGDGLTSIGYSTFYGCTGLTSVTIGNSVTIIGSEAFSGCTSLKSVAIPDSVTSIANGAFFKCASLTSVSIPDSVTSIDSGAFYGCTGLTTVMIGDGVTEIDTNAFEYCAKLEHVWYSGSENDRGNIVINDGNTYLENATWHYNYCGSENHIYDSACDIDCNACGYERTDFHVYENSCDTDCNECGAVRSITHTYDHDCDAVCNICGYERSVPDHIYTNSCDTDCNECGAVRSTTHTYDNACDTTCNVCRHVRETSHVYDNADDVTCNVCKQTLAPVAPTLESVTDTTVTLVAVAGYQYSMDGRNWQNSNVFTGLQPNYSYRFYQRVAETEENLVSPASSPLSVTTDKHLPGVPEDFTFLKITDTSVTLNEVRDCEYSIDGRNWQTSPVFTGLIPGTQYTFYQRIAEDSQNYASDYAVLHITTYSKLGIITYDPNGGQNVPDATTGGISDQTPTRSGYRFVGWALTADTYAVYTPGDPYNQQEDIVLYAAWAELCDVCDGEVYYYGKCLTCLGSGDWTETCSSCGGVGSITREETCSADNCFDGTYIADGVTRKCFTCKGTGKVTKTSDCSNCQNGKVYHDCVMCGGDGYRDRECEQCMSGVQGFTPEAPEMPKLQSISNNTVVLVDYPTCEYSLDGRTWQDSNVFSNLNANTQYVFYQRYKATTYTNHSNTSPALTVKTLKERLQPPQPPVLQSKTFSEVILEKVAGCEYSLDGINWQSDNVFADLLPSTSYTFYCRFAETSTHLHSYASDGLTVVTEQLPSYNVVFLDWDSTVLSTKTYWHGDEVIAPADPTKAADNVYSYIFIGWDKEIVNCIDNATYTAIYSPVYIDYTVVFQNWDGSILSTQTYHYGENVIVPGDPAKAADNVYSYSFSGWDKEVLNCTGHATYTATYTSVYNEYSVVFKDWNGAVLSAATYNWGDEIVVPKNPVREKDEQYEYIFDCWDNEVVNCAGDATYTAVYTAKPLVPTAITSSKYTISGSTISKVGVGTSVSTFVSNLNESKFAKVYQGTTEATGSALIGTGMEVKLTDGNIVGATATVIVTGDTNGDGKITITDMLAVKAHLLKKSTLDGAAAQAGDTSGDNALSITDFLQMKAHILGKSQVEPKSVTIEVHTVSVIEDVEPATQASGETAVVVAVLKVTQIDAIVPEKKILICV